MFKSNVLQSTVWRAKSCFGTMIVTSEIRTRLEQRSNKMEINNMPATGYVTYRARWFILAVVMMFNISNAMVYLYFPYIMYTVVSKLVMTYGKFRPPFQGASILGRYNMISSSNIRKTCTRTI